MYLHPQAQITLTCLSLETQMCRICYPHFMHNAMNHFTFVYVRMWCCVVNECKSHFTSFADPSTEDLGQHCHWVRPTNTVCAGPKCASSNPSPPHPCKAQHAKGTLCCVHCVHTYTCTSQVCVCVHYPPPRDHRRQHGQCPTSPQGSPIRFRSVSAFCDFYYSRHLCTYVHLMKGINFV